MKDPLYPRRAKARHDVALIDARVAKCAKVVLHEYVEWTLPIGRNRERVALEDDISRIGEHHASVRLALDGLLS